MTEAERIKDLEDRLSIFKALHVEESIPIGQGQSLIWGKRSLPASYAGSQWGFLYRAPEFAEGRRLYLLAMPDKEIKRIGPYTVNLLRWWATKWTSQLTRTGDIASVLELIVSLPKAPTR